MKKSKLRAFAFVVLVLGLIFLAYFETANSNSISMTGRQKLLKSVYPLVMGIGKLFGANSKVLANSAGVQPPVSFYSLQTLSNQGQAIRFEEFRGKKVLLVNTASDCGYTGQYDDLEKLYRRFKGKLVIIGFPANDFREQERGNDQQIEKFCRENYGISFPLAKKSKVVRGPGQNKIFEWLSDQQENGWNEQQPTWNFSKYLVNEQGVLTHYFDPSISPEGKEITRAIDQ
jgi:glutathione peroxidase